MASDRTFLSEGDILLATEPTRYYSIMSFDASHKGGPRGYRIVIDKISGDMAWYTSEIENGGDVWTVHSSKTGSIDAIRNEIEGGHLIKHGRRDNRRALIEHIYQHRDGA